MLNKVSMELLKKGCFFVLALALGSCVDSSDAGCSYVTIERYLEREAITEFETTNSGLIYVIEEGTGDPVPVKRVINCVIDGYTLDGQHWATTNPNKPYPIRVGDRIVLPGIEEALTLMRLDEQGQFFLPASLAFGDNGSEPEICPGEPVRIDISSLSVKKNLTEYIAENNIDGLTQTSTGLFFKVTTPGEGDLPASGSIVSLKYTGYLLDGTQFDESDFFDFTVGANAVIPGFEEGIKRFNQGAIGTLYIPFDQAYGPNGTSTGIGGYEDLIFEIEIISVN